MEKPVLNLRFFSLFIFVIPSITAAQNNTGLRIIEADYLESKSINGVIVQQLHGNVVLQRGEITLYTENADYYKEKKEFHLTGGVVMIEEYDTLTCKRMIHYGAGVPFLKAIGKVDFQQSKQRVTCDSLYYWTELDSSSAFGNVHMVQKNRKLQSEQFDYWKTNGYRGSSFSAFGDCNLFDESRVIQASNIMYDDNSQLMTMIDNCSVTEPGRGLSGNTIEIQYTDSLIQELTVFGEAAAFNDLNAKLYESANEYQQFRDDMSSINMKSEFIDNEIETLYLFGMAATLYHMVEDSLLKGLNDASGDTIQVNLSKEGLSRIQVFGGGRGEFTPEKNNTEVDSTVVYRAEYIDYHVKDRQTFLETDALVEYQGTVLSSGYITADWDTNLLEVHPREDDPPIVDTPDGEPVSGDFMEFDLISRHGRVVKGKTSFNDGLYYGREIYRDDPDIFHVQTSKYTSCDAPDPHFYLASRKMKMITGDRVVARPLWLFIYDIPLVGLPLAVFPNKGGGRHSGWIMPSFGTRKRDGTFFQGLGYFWAPNDFIDSRILMNFYDEKGIKLLGNFNYKKRYRYNGSLSTTINRNMMSDDIADIISGDRNQSWDLRWRHNWTIDPTQNLNVNWTYMSNNNYYQDTTFAQTQETRLKQRLESSANYSKQWTAYKNSMSINISESTDLLNSEKKLLGEEPSAGDVIFYKTRYLPRLTFRHGQSKLFGNGSHWYHSLYWSVSSNLTQLQKIGFTADSSQNWSDTTNTNQVISHSLSFSSPQKFFGWLTLNPRLSIKEDWIFKYRNYYKAEPGVYETVNGFLPRHTGSASLSANTKIYGVFPIGISNFESFRHILSPSVSYSWRPDFSKKLFGIDLGYFQKDIEGNLHDRFAGSMAGGTSKQEQKTMSFSLNNLFQAKFRDDENNFTKVDLLTWNMNSGYNFAADSMNFSPVRSSLRTTLPGGFKLDVSMTHDLYQLKPDTIGNLKRVNILGKPRFTTVSGGTSLRLSGKRFLGFTSSVEDSDTTVTEDDDITEYFSTDLDPQLGDGNLWETSMSFRYSLNQIIDGDEVDMNKTFWMNTSLKLNITENWTMQHSARFDLIERNMVFHEFSFNRPLHCWTFSFEWTPSGPGKGFFLKINVKNPDLQDIKLESRGGRSFYSL